MLHVLFTLLGEAMTSSAIAVAASRNAIKTTATYRKACQQKLKKPLFLVKASKLQEKIINLRISNKEKIEIDREISNRNENSTCNQNMEAFNRATTIHHEKRFAQPKLYPSEIAVLYWAAKGKTSHETALILDLSENTIKTYRRDAIKKMKANNITHAVFKAIKWNIFKQIEKTIINKKHAIQNATLYNMDK